MRELTATPVPGLPGTFELAGPVPSGWVQVELGIGAAEGGAGRARLEGENVSVPLPLGRDGTARTVARLPPVSSLRLEIDRTGPQAPPRLTVRKLRAVEAAARLAAPVVLRRLREPWDIPLSALKLLSTLRRGGFRGVADRLVQKEQRRSPQVWYREWCARFDTLSDADRAAIRARCEKLQTRFSVVMPVYETPEPLLRKAIDSVRRQLYPRWELCIADDASKAPHVRRVLEEAMRDDARIKVTFREQNGHISAASNSALTLASGDWVALLDHDDELAEHALYMMAEEIAAHPDADLVYSDEDKIDHGGRRFDPHLKPDWNPDLFWSQNYLAHLCVLRRSRVVEVGGFREGFEGSQDYDLYLRAGQHVRHVPFVLYHWRAIEGSTAQAASAKSYAQAAGERALRDKLGLEIAAGPFPTTYRVRWPAPSPLVTLVIPTRDQCAVLRNCIESIRRTTAYRNYELIVVDNQSRDRETLAYLSSLDAKVLRYDQPFNFSAINNLGVREARGEVVGLLNNDLEAIEPDWLGEMVAQAMRPEIGAVGARLLYPDRTLQHGGIILGIGGVAGHAHKYSSEADPGYFSRAQLVQDVSAVTAACLLVRHDTYLRAGGLDEGLAVAFNDVDFCLRVRALGLRNLWTPFATLLHHESRTRGPENTPAKRARFRREKAVMHERWADALRADPAYSPNLTLESEDFSLAWPPRVKKPWL